MGGNADDLHNGDRRESESWCPAGRLPSAANDRRGVSHPARRPAHLAAIGDVQEMIDSARESASRPVNAAMTAAFRLIGGRNVEFGQSGEERPEKGTARLEGVT